MPAAEQEHPIPVAGQIAALRHLIGRIDREERAANKLYEGQTLRDLRAVLASLERMEKLEAVAAASREYTDSLINGVSPRARGAAWLALRNALAALDAPAPEVGDE